MNPEKAVILNGCGATLARDELSEALGSLQIDGLEEELKSLRTHPIPDTQDRLIRTYHFGETGAPCIVLLAPSGVSFLLIARLAAVLAREFHVVTWEAPGCPDLTQRMTDDDTTLEKQAAQFLRVLEAGRIAEFHLVGWCQAPQRALHAMQRGQLRPRTLTLIAPAGLGYAQSASDFERCALPIYRQIALNDAAYAAKMSRILDSLGKMSCPKPTSSRTDPMELLAARLSTLHLASIEGTLRFARYMQSFDENKTQANLLLREVLPFTQTLLIHCKDDTVSHYTESVRLAQEVRKGDCRILPDGGHLLLFTQPQRVARMIAEFVVEARSTK